MAVYTGSFLRRLLPLLAAGGLLAGCAAAYARVNVSEKDYRAAAREHPAYLGGMVRDLLEEGRRNEVLNWNRMALRALRRGDREVAKRYFDGSIREINRVFSNSERAKKARSLWFREEIKDFKGDPYERAMVFFYRGLLYYMDGELDNARAAFRSGQIQDAFAEEAQNRSDFAVFDYLDARVTQRIDSPEDAVQAFARARSLRRRLSAPGAEENVLLVATLNRGPAKYTAPGRRHELLYHRGPERLKSILILKDGLLLGAAVRAGDLNYQATTRGGREFASILNGKVQFKKTTDTLGTGALATGVILSRAAAMERDSNRRGALAVGSLAALAVGGTLKAISALTRTEADTRTWTALPGQIYLWSGKLPPGEHELEFRYYWRDVWKPAASSAGGAWEEAGRMLADLDKFGRSSQRVRRMLRSIGASEERDSRRRVTVRVEPGKKDHLVFVPSPNAHEG
ncbi:MAG: hypothetical protein V3V62_00805 [bacterium]